MLAPESEEVIRLEKKSRSKLSYLIRPFDYDKLNNLYDLFVSQREKSSEQRYFSERSRLSHTPVNNGNSKESFNKQTTLLEKQMDESILRINASLEQFHVCLNEEIVADLRYFNSLKLEVDSLRSQLETQKTQFLNEIDRLSREYYYADHMNAILGVHTELDEVTNLQCDYLELLGKCECLEKELSKSKMMSKSFEALQKHAINLEIDLQQCQEKIKHDKSFKVNQSKEFCKEREQYFEIQDLKAQLQDKGIVIRVNSTTSGSRPQLKSNPIGDTVMRNNSQGKKQDVEDHRRSVKFSKNKTPVTACNDSLKAKTLNVNFVTKMPIVVPVSTREPKCTVKQFVDKPFKKSVVTESNQKPRNITRKLYERVSKACSWWYPKFTPLGYKWKPKSEKENVNPNLVKIVLFIVDSGCSKHMTGNLKLLINFVEKFLGTVKFRNDQIAHILGYGDLIHLDSFLRSKDKTPKVLIDFLKLVQKGLQAQVRIVQTDKGTKFLNQTLHAYFDAEGILHQTSVARTPEQNGVVKRQNRTLVEAARTMLSAAKVPLFFGLKQLPHHVLLKTITSVPSFCQDLCQRMALEHDSLCPDPQCQENVTHVDKTVTTSNEMDSLFSLMFDEFLNGSSKIVSKSSAVSTVDAPNQRQQHTTPLNNHTTHAPTCQVPTQAPTVASPENMNQAKMVEEYAQVENDEFINILCTPVQDRGEKWLISTNKLAYHKLSNHR
uniref:Putative ribonuclease H-like domain-containing protein n=1 Tax=Tanacetum cinerariifolium TaxID=118510 RepID=A0A6L2KVT5_TANCI|nr:putative ribonuclease H-like domain-containing protein [Tanacetum cinerariifolium]